MFFMGKEGQDHILLRGIFRLILSVQVRLRTSRLSSLRPDFLPTAVRDCITDCNADVFKKLFKVFG